MCGEDASPSFRLNYFGTFHQGSGYDGEVSNNNWPDSQFSGQLKCHMTLYTRGDIVFSSKCSPLTEVTSEEQ